MGDSFYPNFRDLKMSVGQDLLFASLGLLYPFATQCCTQERDLGGQHQGLPRPVTSHWVGPWFTLQEIRSLRRVRYLLSYAIASSVKDPPPLNAVIFIHFTHFSHFFFFFF